MLFLYFDQNNLQQTIFVFSNQDSIKTRRQLDFLREKSAIQKFMQKVATF